MDRDFGRGLARLRGGEWKRFTKAEGLISDSITYLLEDAEGYLWIGSNVGLMRIKKQALNDFAGGSLPCRSYGKQDGLPNHGIRQATPSLRPAGAGTDGCTSRRLTAWLRWTRPNSFRTPIRRRW